MGVERITIHFSDEQGRVVETKDYNVHRVVFEVSGHLNEEAERYQCSVSEHERQNGQSQVKLTCDSFVFDIVADLLDEKVLDIEIKAMEVVNSLKLASILKIKDKKMRLYRNLARAVVNSCSLRAEIEGREDVPDIKLFVLQLMREHVGLYDVDVRVDGNRATVCPNNEHLREAHGLRDKIDVIDEICILNSAMNTLQVEDCEFLRALEFYVHTMNIRVLEVDYCRPGAGMIGCIRSMKSLTRLSMKGFGNDVLSGLSSFKALENLTELDISGNRMSNKRLRKIGALANLRKLNLESCGLRAVNCCGLRSGDLRCIESLERLTELSVGRNKLKRSDMRVIGEMRSLRKLSMGHCNMKAGNIKYLKDLEHLEELDISKNRLSKGDLEVIGKMKGLLRLRINKCDWKACMRKFMCRTGNLECLKNLDNLIELHVSDTDLNTRDMAGIGKIVNLLKLEMGLCRIKPGSLAKLDGLNKLRELRIFKTRRLNKKDQSTLDLLVRKGVRVER